MSSPRDQSGVTLIELVVILAVLGVLAAVGTPMLLNNIRVAKNVDAQNTLKSIYMMQKNFFAENNCYYTSTSRTNINQFLFGSQSPTSGPIAGSTTNDFDFSIVPGVVGQSGSCSGSNSNDYVATAMSRTNNTIIYTINQQNIKTGF